MSVRVCVWLCVHAAEYMLYTMTCQENVVAVKKSKQNKGTEAMKASGWKLTVKRKVRMEINI